MRPVQLSYADIPFKQTTVRLIRFPDAPQGPPVFVPAGAIAELDPNEHLPERIQQEAQELFKSSKVQIYFDSTALLFQNAQEVADFPAALVNDNDSRFTWQQVTLQAQYA